MKQPNDVIATQARMRLQIEEQQQALKDLCAWEDAIEEGQQRKLLADNKEKLNLEQNKDDKINLVLNKHDHSQVAVKINDEDGERNIGNSYYLKGDYIQAAQSYSKCISINPDSAVAYSNRGLYFCLN